MFISDKCKLYSLAMMIGTFVTQNVFADKIGIGFYEAKAAVHSKVLSADAAKACTALEKIYSVEDGYLGCVQGRGTSITVIMSKRIYINRLWRKMLDAGHAGYENKLAYFYYNQSYTSTPYKFFGKVYFEDDRKLSAQYDTQGGKPQFIIGYMISIHKACTINSSGVIKASKITKIKPTVLDRKTRLGNSIQYHYTVNGGDGTDILGLAASIAPGHWPIFNNCEANFYVNYGDQEDDNPPEPE